MVYVTVDADASWSTIMRKIRNARSSRKKEADRQKTNASRPRRTAKARKGQRGKGLLLGPNSPFDGIPLIGDIL